MPRTLTRVILGLLAASSVIVGVWAGFAPRSFYDQFPGGGRHWVGADGPYNEHLIRDVGVLNLALAFVLVVALVHLTPVLVRTAAIAALLYNVPHFVYHARHLGLYDASDKVALVVSLGLAIGGPVVLLLLDSALERQPAVQSTSKVPPVRQ
jgi:hypothetical protein